MSLLARMVVLIGLLTLLAAGPLALANARSSQLQAGELLVNPGFEDPFVPEGSADISVANGWQAWYVTPDGVNYPTTCSGSDPNCKPYRIPVYHASQPQDPRIPPRAISGNSQQWGISYAVYIAGVYQQVGNITPGTNLNFSAHTQGFNCNDDQGCFGSAKHYGYSSGAGDMQTRVGIDPTGGTNAFAPTVIWSSFANPLDAFVQQSVGAVAQSDKVTVFIWSSPNYPEKHTDIYVDNASLIAVGQGATPTAGPTQSSGTPGPAPTLPAGTTAYNVVAGDTLATIALRFNLTLDQLLALNPQITNPSAIQVGQAINVAGPVPTQAATQAPTNTPAPTATPQPSPTSALTATSTPETTTVPTTTVPTPAPTLIASNSGLCLQAFDDLNANSVRDANEALLPGVKFNILAEGGQTTTYTTKGQQEPYCLNNLPDGRYTVTAIAPTGETATTDAQWAVSLLSGTNVNIAFGAQQAATPTPEPKPIQSPTPEPVSETVVQPTNSSTPLALLGGGALMILAVVALFFGLRSRNKSA